MNRAGTHEIVAVDSDGILSGVDPREVACFNASARAGKATKDGRQWLHRYNPVRTEFVRRTAAACLPGVERQDALRGLRILDVGCGTGIFCEALAEAGAQVTGLDPARDALALAAASARDRALPIAYEQDPARCAAQRFTVVTAMEVIEHVPDYAAFLAQCAAQVEPGGLLVLSTISRTWKSFAYAIVAAEYLLHLLPRGSHQWERFVRPSEVADVLQRLGFRVVAASGATMSLRHGRMKECEDLSVNYMLAAQRIE